VDLIYETVSYIADGKEFILSILLELGMKSKKIGKKIEYTNAVQYKQFECCTIFWKSKFSNIIYTEIDSAIWILNQ
jgi:hypothetical protein